MATPRPKANDMFTALAHPLRREILRRMLAQKRETSPRDLATQLSEPLSALSYHVRVLAECEAVKLVRTQRIRGSTQRLYRPAVKLEWARLALATPEPQRRRKESGRGDENR